MAIYSASHVESAMIFCLDEVQWMGVLLKVWTILEYDMYCGFLARPVSVDVCSGLCF